MNVACSRTLLSLAAALVLTAPVPALAADIDIDVHIGSPPEQKVVYIYHDYYRLPEDDVLVVVRERPEEAPAILEIARLAGVPALDVLQLRRERLSLFDIVLRLRLSPDVLFVAVPADARLGPPYGNAWGYWRKHGRDWPRGVTLSDDEVIAVSRVKLLSDYFHEEPVRVMERLSASKMTPLLVSELDEKHLKHAGGAGKGKAHGGESPKAKPGAGSTKGNSDHDPGHDAGKGEGGPKPDSHGGGKPDKGKGGKGGGKAGKGK